MNFLTGPQAEDELRKLLRQGSPARLAVAYWGKGAVKRLGISESNNHDIIVVCDVRSGGCNPEEIKKLQKLLGKSRVLTRDGLHAKVWHTQNGAIVGSSNASANGLGGEGDELEGSLEGNLLVADPAVLQAIQNWFDGHVMPGARPITDADLREAKSRRMLYRRIRPLPMANSILELLCNNPGALRDRDFFVWVWPMDDLDHWAEEELQAERGDYPNFCV